MPVEYNGQPIIPAPYIDFKQIAQESGDGRLIARNIGATLTGNLVTRKDAYTPTIVDADEALSVVLAKQKVLRDIFSVNGKLFKVSGFDTSPTEVEFKANVKSINFQDGPWIDVCQYTIELESTEFEGEGEDTSPIDSVSESWEFEDGDVPGTYRVSHAMSAKGKTVYEDDGTLLTLAWERAKAFVIANLKMGWTATSTWSPKSGSTIWQNAQDFDSSATAVYNRVMQESVNEAEGTYNVTESYLVSPTNYTQEITYSVKKVTQEVLMTTVVTVQGVIKGLYINLHDYATKLTNAKARWEILRPTLFSLASSQAPSGVTLNTKAAEGNYEINANDGSISFNYEFSDKIIVGDTLETYTLEKSITYESPLITVTISGTIQGILYPTDTDYTQKYVRANARWLVVRNLLYTRCLTVCSTLSAFPIDTKYTPDQIGGTVGYSYTFDNRPNSKVIDDWTVSRRYSRQDGVASITVSGNIKGLYNTLSNGEPAFTSYEERFDNAMEYWLGIKDNLFGRVTDASFGDTEVNPTPMGTSLEENRYQGTIGYSVEYDNTPSPCITGALSEVITIVKDNAVPVIALQPIPFRTQGPIIQNLETLSEKRLTVTIEAVMPRNYTTMGDAVCTRTFAPPDSDGILDYIPTGEAVYKQQDNDTWSPTTGRFSRVVSWLYV